MVSFKLKPKNILIPFFPSCVSGFKICRPKGLVGELVICLEVTKKTCTYEYTEPIKLAIKYILFLGSFRGGWWGSLVTVN